MDKEKSDDAIHHNSIFRNHVDELRQAQSYQKGYHFSRNEFIGIEKLESQQIGTYPPLVEHVHGHFEDACHSTKNDEAHSLTRDDKMYDEADCSSSGSMQTLSE